MFCGSIRVFESQLAVVVVWGNFAARRTEYAHDLKCGTWRALMAGEFGKCLGFLIFENTCNRYEKC